MASKNAPRKLSQSEFQHVFRAVRDDINDLQLHNKVFVGVIEQLGKHERLGINFRVFFTVILAALRTDLIIRLGRVYDPEGTGHESCTLARCVHTLRENPQFFTDAAIIARLTLEYREANKGFLSDHRLDLKQVQIDLARIADSRQRLTNLRHKVYAHKDLETVLSNKRDEFLSTHEEVVELIRMAHRIWNRYAQIWNASSWSEMTIGEDDYKWLFDYLLRGMSARK